MTNTEILCWVLGWQGGTLAQVADTLETSDTVVLAAEGECLRDLCRKAQLVRNKRDLDSHVLRSPAHTQIVRAADGRWHVDNGPLCNELRTALIKAGIE